MPGKTRSEKFTCCSIALSYAILGGVWTFFSDSLFAILLHQPVQVQKSVAISHWGFILCSALLLYWLLRYWDVAISHSQQSLYAVNRAVSRQLSCPV